MFVYVWTERTDRCFWDQALQTVLKFERPENPYKRIERAASGFQPGKGCSINSGFLCEIGLLEIAGYPVRGQTLTQRFQQVGQRDSVIMSCFFDHIFENRP